MDYNFEVGHATSLFSDLPILYIRKLEYCENCQCWDNATGFCHVKMIITLADEVCESYKEVK